LIGDIEWCAGVVLVGSMSDQPARSYPEDYEKWVVRSVSEIANRVWDFSSGTLNLKLRDADLQEIAEIIRRNSRVVPATVHPKRDEDPTALVSIDPGLAVADQLEQSVSSRRVISVTVTVV
jgi:hypothetical protein